MRTNDISITVEKIYHAAADPRGWNAVLSDIASITKSTMSCLFWSGSRRTHYDYIASLGVPEWYLKEYAEYFVETDEWFKGGRGILKSGWVGRSQELCSDQRLARTEFYSDFLRRADVFHQCGGVMTMAGCRLATVSLLRPKKLGAYDQSSVEAIKLLMPHLQRAMRLHEKFVDLREHDMSMEAALQTLATAMILTDSERKVLFANRAAQAILDRRDGLLVVRGGIGATSRSESTQLSALVGAATPRVG
jgi:PAS domain-containing protein